MKRRELILGIAGVIVVSLPSHAQQNRTPIVGFLSSSGPGRYVPSVEDFRQGLAEYGLVEGRDLIIEFRWAEGRYERLPDLAAELVRRPVDVIVAASTLVAHTAKNATQTIPIVFSVGGDPVGAGLAASLAKPGGNLTGVSFLVVELHPKRFQLLMQVVPNTRSIALLVNPDHSESERVIREVEAAATADGVSLLILKARNQREIKDAFGTLAQSGAGGLVLQADPFILSSFLQGVDVPLEDSAQAGWLGRRFCRSGNAHFVFH